MTRPSRRAEPQHSLARLLDTPHLIPVIQSLEPRVLLRLVRHFGLEDSGEIVALATTQQLTRMFDDDLWRSDVAGAEEQFDADRFGLWLEVLTEMGAEAAARSLADLDFDFVTAAFSRLILVLDQESLMAGRAAHMGFDDDDPARETVTEKALEDCASCELGGYVVVARHTESWDALLSVLTSLDHEHHAFFDRLMKRCCRISTEHVTDNGGLYEVLTTEEQVMADVAGAREERREHEGYLAPSLARAFLALARDWPEGGAAADPVTSRYFRELEHRAKVGGEGSRRADGGPQGGTLERQVFGFLETLAAESRGKARPRPLLSAEPGKGEDRLSRIRAQLSFVREHDPAAWVRRTEELAFLGNALVAGCSFQSRRFRAVEAADAVLATCNLGLENWGPPALALPADLLIRQDVVTVFRTGWHILHEDVCLFSAQRLVDVLSELRCDDEELQQDVRELSRRMKTQVAAGTPWRERDNLDAVATLDQASWMVLLNLVDECPVVPRSTDRRAAPQPELRVTPEWEFISERRQIAWVRDYVESLPERLREPLGRPYRRGRSALDT